jgi:hypothetical protein
MGADHQSLYAFIGVHRRLSADNAFSESKRTE